MLLSPSLTDSGLLYVEAMRETDHTEMRLGAEPPSGIVGGLTTHGWSPDRYGNITVFEEWGTKDSHIVIHDERTDTTRDIPDASIDQSPAIWGDIVVFTRFHNGRRRLMAYSLSTGDFRELDGERWPSDPDIYESTVVYEAGGDIWTVDLGGTQSRRIATAEGDLCCPAVWGDNAAYTDWSEGLADIRLVNLDNGIDIALTTSPGVEHAPSLWGNQLAFEDYGTMPDDDDSHIVVTRVRATATGKRLSGADSWLSPSVRQTLETNEDIRPTAAKQEIHGIPWLSTPVPFRADTAGI
ncbi:MAG: hypothetical protein HY876_10130 [Coriobacteriales bacterium]|nr:hypothetical protein [Coriobacteriales bacterium]